MEKNADAAIDKAAGDVAQKDPAPAKPTVITRELDRLDRFLILEALDNHIGGDKERSRVQGQYRLTKLNRLLDRGEIEEWRDACEYDVREADAKRIEQNVQMRMGNVESIKGADGKIVRHPRLTMPDAFRQNRGKRQAIEFEPRLDVLIQDALKAMPFSPNYAEDAVDLCQRYEINVDAE
jgi:hypothetical protein